MKRLDGIDCSNLLFDRIRLMRCVSGVVTANPAPQLTRTKFSSIQVVELEKAFEKRHYIVGTEKRELANRIVLTEKQVGDRSLDMNV